MRKQRCGNCRWWGEYRAGPGDCQRHAPKLVVYEDGGTRTCWPKTYEKGHCGEWEPREDASPSDAEAKWASCGGYSADATESVISNNDGPIVRYVFGGDSDEK